MKPGKLAAALVGALIGLVAVGLIVGGLALTWAYGTQRDAEGFLTSPDYEVTTSRYALVSDRVTLAPHPGDWLPSGLLTTKVTAEPEGPGEIFVGIGPSADIDRYLQGVGREELSDFGMSSSDFDTRSFDGGAPPGPPGGQGFWVASSEGPGSQVVTWELERGSWTAVVMNADGSAGIDVAVEAGASIDVLLPVAVGLLIGGLVLGGLAALLLVIATRRDRAEPLSEPEATVPRPERAAAAGTYPVLVEGSIDPELSRWLWLVKWLLAIPHLVVLAFLWIAYVLLSIIAFFAILFTGRYPRGIFDFNVGVLRWHWRVGFYAFTALGTDRYPPFTLADVDYPARLDVAYPEELSRGLVLVKSWLLAIPHYLIVGVLTSGLIWWTTNWGDGDRILEIGGGLIGVLVLIAAVVLAFTGSYPTGLFDLIMGFNRWVFRVVAYASLMRDEYPPFRLDLGGTEPRPAAPDFTEDTATPPAPPPA